MDGEINYNQLVERALIDVVRKSLIHAAEFGLSGQQHFYITFWTHQPDVSIPSHLTERYKEEMTIVLQHQYWNLKIEDTFFSLELSFNHKRETLVIPFDAVTAFADPSVQFGLQFNLSSNEMKESAGKIATESGDDQKPTPVDTSANEAKAGEVITLDAFRKK
ncbi:MAG: hypothetical protein JKX94_00375 [Sneathiella sp.]|nr:hypothetical protein [Sneathiella sp.]